jgi:hypothetical protein
LLASLAYLQELVFDFSGFARKIKHFPFFASEASAKNLALFHKPYFTNGSKYAKSTA